MKFYVISDNKDTLVGMRLAGIPGEVAHDAEGLRAALQNAQEDADIGIVLFTEKLRDLAPEQIDQFRLRYEKPLLIGIPDRHGSGREKDSIARYVREAIGIKI